MKICEEIELFERMHEFSTSVKKLRKSPVIITNQVKAFLRDEDGRIISEEKLTIWKEYTCKPAF